MTLATLFLIGAGLSMDAFAVSVCEGLRMKKLSYVHTLTIALMFGGFQALMPLIGWAVGRHFEQYIISFDHWIAFGLLAFIGGKMFLESFQKDDCMCGDKADVSDRADIKELLILAVATSIDALAVGITFAFLSTGILRAITVIGLTTFVIAAGGVILGNRFGAKYEKKAQTVGGIILIGIGIKILLEHMGIL